MTIDESGLSLWIRPIQGLEICNFDQIEVRIIF